MSITQLEPIGISAGEDDEERRRREAEMRASMEADDIADGAIAGLGDLDLPDEAPLPSAASVMGEARGSSWRDQPGAQATGERGVMFPPQPPARTPPSLAGEAEAPQPMVRPAVAPPSAPMATPAVVRDAPTPMDAPPSDLGPRQTAPAPSAASPSAPPMASEQPSPSAPKKPPMREPGRLDEGLPSEADIRGAVPGDVARRILAAIGGAMGGYVGRSPAPFRSEEAELRARRDAGLQRAQAAKGDAIERQDRLGREESQVELQRAALEDRGAQRQASQAMQERRMALTERSLDRDIADEERTRSQDAALDDASSDASRSARTLLSARLSQLPEVQRRAAIEAIGGAEALPQMTGRQARELLGGNILARAPQMRGGRGGGAGAGNPVRSGRAPTAEDRDSLVARAVELDIPQEAAETMSLADLNREILARTRADHSAETRATRAPQGPRATAQTEAAVERLGRAVDSSLTWRQSLQAARRIDPSLLQAVFLSRNIPPGFTPQQVQQARGSVERMISARANLLSGAAVSEAELGRITTGMGVSASSSPQAFIDFLTAEERAESERAARVRARYSADVVREYDRRLSREGAPGAAPRQAPAQTFNATINGTVRRFPTEEARQQAAQIAEQRGDTFEVTDAAR